MMHPERRAIISLPKCLQQKNVPFRLTSSTFCQSEAGMSSGSEPHVMPALFTRISTDRNSAIDFAASSFTSSSRDTSHPRERTFTPCLRRISSAVAVHLSFFREQRTRSAPASARPCAISLPSPIDPPVTTATFPFKPNIFRTFMSFRSFDPIRQGMSYMKRLEPCMKKDLPRFQSFVFSPTKSNTSNVLRLPESAEGDHDPRYFYI